MMSLRTLAALKPATLYPAHGRAITTAPAVASHIQQYISHRVDREAQILSLLSTLSVPHGLHTALVAYFDKRNAEAIKQRKEDREFLTGLPYKGEGEKDKGGKMKKAGYGTLKWVSEAGSDDEGDVAGRKGDGKEVKVKDEKLKPGKYGYGKPMPEGFEEKGLLRGKDVGKEVKPVLEDEKDKGSEDKDLEEKEDKAEGDVASEDKGDEAKPASDVNTKSASAKTERLVPLPNLAPFDSSHPISIPISMLARLLYDTSDEKTIWAGGKSILAHLEKLKRDGKVRRVTSTMPEIKELEVGEEKVGEGWEVVV